MDAKRFRRAGARSAARALGFCGLLAAALGLVLAAAAAFPRSACAAQQVVGAADALDTAWTGSRKVFYDEGHALVWTFFETAGGLSYQAYNPNTAQWLSEGVAISTNYAAANPSYTPWSDANTMYGSVYYDQASSTVYAVASDPNAQWTGAPANSENYIYLNSGGLNADGTISWSGATFKKPVGRVAGNNNSGCLAGGNVDVVLDDLGTVDALCDAKVGNNNWYTSTLGYFGMNANGTFSGGTTAAPDSNAGSCNETNSSPARLQYGVLAAVNDGGNGTSNLVIEQSDRADNTGNFRATTYTSAAAYKNRDIACTNSGGTIAPQPGQSVTWDPTYSYVHAAYVDGSGALVYRERTGYGTWSGATTIDACGGSVSAPCGAPSVTYVNGAAPELFVVYESSYDSLNYASCPLTTQTNCQTGTNWTITHDWQNPLGGDTYPSAPRSVDAPYPIPVIWDGAGGVTFDRIIDSTLPGPAVASISSSPATAPYSTNAYDLIVYDGGGATYFKLGSLNPSVQILDGSGNPQN
ncbi:MAG: hypothetical protein KGI84_09290, partial [Elusimicrobia bacterium]|nr:hypothetical protein [Elusimicrobiota bacterium]